MSRKVDQQKIKDILKKRGYTNGKPPRGKEVHHIVPRVKGGKETSKNLVIIPAWKHRQIHKNRRERGEE